MTITEQIFMGNCKGGTESKILEMYKLLKDGLDIVNYIQQPSRSSSEAEAIYNQGELSRLNAELEHITKQLAYGLTGKEIMFLKG